MKYRAEIDGLRAVAVVPVVLFHAGFELFGGGFVGVDIFFVISGYLITTILIDDIEQGRFSLISFYERRARRILPALFFVMLACIPFAILWMLPGQLEDFWQSLVAVSFFSSNILFWRESGYFATDAEEKPLLHTWSLAVEEQYYLLFPVFLFFAWRYGKDRVFYMIVVMAAISLALSEWGWRNNPSANFYLAPTRAWELFAGSISAFVVKRNGVTANNTLSLFGLAAILFSIFAYNESTPFPSIYALLPVGGVVLLILFAARETIAAKILSTGLLVGIGLISYSTYLWHQPLFAFARVAQSDPPSTILMIGLIALSFLLAYFSWRFVERPFRNRIRIGRPRVFKLTGVFAALFIAVGVGGAMTSRVYEEFWVSRQAPSVAQAYRLLQTDTPMLSKFGADADGNQTLGECRFNLRQFSDSAKEKVRECAAKYGPGVLILGDSHAIDLFGVVASRFDDEFLIGLTKGGCLPSDLSNGCQYEAVEAFLSQNPQTFRKVIYEVAAFTLLKRHDGAKGSRKIFASVPRDLPVPEVSLDDVGIQRNVAYLGRIGRYADIVWFTPRAAPHISQREILEKGCDGAFKYRENHVAVIDALARTLTEAVEESGLPGVEVVDQNEVFQFDLSTDLISCAHSYWLDGDHLTAEGEAYFGRRLPADFLD